MPQPSHPPLNLTRYKRQQLIQAVRACRSAVAMYEVSDNLGTVMEKLTEAEMWLARTPVSDDTDRDLKGAP